MALTFGPLYKDFYSDLKKRREDEAAAAVQGIKLAPVQSLQWQGPRVQSAPSQSIWDKTRDVFDANSPMDKFKRQQAGEPTDYFQQQREVYGNNRAATNLGGALLGGSARFLNTGAAAINEVVDTARVQFAPQDMKSAYMKVLDENQKARFAENSGLGGQGTWFKSQEDYRKTASNPAELLKRAALNVGETALEAGSFGAGGARNKLAEQGTKQFIKTGAKKAAVRAGEGMASDAMGQTFQRDKWSPEQTLMSGAVAVALPIAAGGVTKGGKMAVKAVSEYEPKMRAGFVKIPGMADDAADAAKPLSLIHI